MKLKYLFILLSFSLISQGCLVFNKISYNLQLNSEQKGTATIKFYDIRSDAFDEKEFNEDKKTLFDVMLKSDEFITNMKKEGRDIIFRQLSKDGNKLNGTVKFNFYKISTVENIMYEDGFYFLTLPLEDSVISTNGQIIKSKNYKRILWDKSFKNLSFEIFSQDMNKGGLKPLVQYLKEEKK